MSAPGAPLAGAAPEAPANRTWIMTALIFGIFLAAVESTVVATAMPAIVADLGGLQYYGWLGASYLLATTVTIPLYGKLADLYGRKPIFLLGLAVFLLGCVLCAAAPSLAILIAGRVVQGIGAGAIHPVAMTIVGDLYAVRERAKIQGVLGAVWGMAGIAGPQIGGILVEVASWRWVFWINLPFGLVSALLMLVVFREKRVRHPEIRVDWLGGALIACTTVAVLFSAEGHWPVLLALVAVLLGGMFILVERRAHDPVVPLGLALRPDVAVATASAVLVGVTLMSVVSYLPLMLQSVRGLSPTQAGAVLAPMLLGWPIAATTSSHFLVRTGVRAPALFGSMCLTCGFALLVWSLAFSDARVPVFVAMFIAGVGMGLCTTTLLIALQARVPWQQRGVVTALNMFARTLGGAMGVGVLGALLAAGLASRLDAGQVNDLLHASQGGSAGIHLDPASREVLQASLMPLFWVMAAVSVLNLFVVWCYPRGISLATPALGIEAAAGPMLDEESPP